MTTRHITVREAIEQVEQFLLDRWENQPENAKVKIQTWGVHVSGWSRHRSTGLRVQQVDLSVIDLVTQTGSGHTFRHADLPAGAAACLCAERAIIARLECWSDDGLQEVNRRLLAAVYGTDKGESWSVVPK